MNVKKSLWFASLLIIGLGLVVSGCTKKIANTEVSVDTSKDKVTINTNSGSYVAGEKVSLPTGFPSDIYVIDGTIKTAITLKENDSYNISIETSKSVSEAQTLYNQKLQDEGWEVKINTSYENSAAVGAEKNDRTITISITQSEGKTLVVIGTLKNSSDFNVNSQ